jgi:diaminobutyrate-2-oxoglutarate transaminase
VSTAIFERLESNVRSYCRSFPAVFARASGCYLYDESGRAYLDFFCGAGALNYGHNPAALKAPLLDYLHRDGVMHSLDMYTQAKADFLRAFEAKVLAPRGLEYRVQFPGPTGTNAVESALKIARKVTGRSTIMAFTNAFHGMTLGSLAVSANPRKRAGARVTLGECTRVPFDGFMGPDVDTLDYVRAFLEQPGSGVDLPAAIIVESIQAEGGLHTASERWLRGLASLARAHDILLIVDDVQAGCGRTGTFFSFEPYGVVPDVVCLSKSISGYGLPMSLTLLRPGVDVWAPGEHNGTFRGNNLAFVAARAALDEFWSDGELQRKVQRQGVLLGNSLQALVARHPEQLAGVRGRGLLQGVVTHDPALAKEIARSAFDRGLLVETAGPDARVIKLMPALIISDELLLEGVRRLEVAMDMVSPVAGASSVANLALQS